MLYVFFNMHFILQFKCCFKNKFHPPEVSPPYAFKHISYIILLNSFSQIINNIRGMLTFVIYLCISSFNLYNSQLSWYYSLPSFYKLRLHKVKKFA